MTENIEISTPVDTAEPVNVETETQNPVDVTPEGTAPEGEENKQEERKKTFTQEEVDVLIQKRLLKKEREVFRNIQRQQAEEARRARIEQEPRREQFNDDDAYLEAKLEQLAEKKAIEKIQHLERQREQEKSSEAFLERAEKAAEKYADFHEVVADPKLRINDSMVEFISESDVGHEVAYYLGKHPEVAAKIADMSPMKAARELSKIESEVGSKSIVKTSSAPAPITPIGNRGSAQTSLEKLSFAEYKEQRMKMNPSWRK